MKRLVVILIFFTCLYAPNAHAVANIDTYWCLLNNSGFEFNFITAKGVIPYCSENELTQTNHTSPLQEVPIEVTQLKKPPSVGECQQLITVLKTKGYNCQEYPGAIGILSQHFNDIPVLDLTTAQLIDFLQKPPGTMSRDDINDVQSRAQAIDLLASRRDQQAVPVLITCLSDTRTLNGNDNWVGGHAANALEAITGQHFGVDREKWDRWLAQSNSVARQADPTLPDEAGVVMAQARGKLVRNGQNFFIQTKNPGFPEIYLIPLARSEDKNRDLDAYLASQEGKVVGLKGELYFYPRLAHGGSEAVIAINSTSQFDAK